MKVTVHFEDGDVVYENVQSVWVNTEQEAVMGSWGGLKHYGHQRTAPYRTFYRKPRMVEIHSEELEDKT
jgi:hypothetical protein